MYSVHLIEGTYARNISKYLSNAEISYVLNGGNESFSATSQLPIADHIKLSQLHANREIIVCKHAKIIWRGRIDDFTLFDGGGEIRSYGLRQRLTDIGIVQEFFTTSSRNDLIPYTTETNMNFVSNESLKAYDVSRDDAVITLVKDAAIPNNGNNGFMWLLGDFASTGSGTVAVDVEYRLPTGFDFYIQQRSGYGQGEAALNPAILSTDGLSGTGSLTRSTDVYTLNAATDAIGFFIYNATGGTYTNTQETGYWYIKIIYHRIVRDTRVIIASIASAVSSGVQTVTPDTMANINVGDVLLVGNGVTARDFVVVTAKTATTFTANFPRAYSAGAIVRGWQITAADMVQRYMTQTNLFTSVDIQPTGIDVENIDLQGMSLVQALDQLATIGNGSEPYIYGVDENGRFYTRAKSAVGETYYADIDTFSLTHKLNTIANRIYATYTNSDRVSHIAAAIDDTVSQSTYGLLRTASYASDQEHYTAATVEANAVLQDKKKITAESMIQITRFVDRTGGVVAKDDIRPGDKIILRNIPIQLLGTFKEYYTISQTKIALDTGEVAYTFDQPLTTLEQLLRYRDETRVLDTATKYTPRANQTSHIEQPAINKHGLPQMQVPVSPRRTRNPGITPPRKS